VTTGDSVSAKLDALIDRASVMIVELSSSWTRAEYRMALARLKGAESESPRRAKLRLIVVVTPSEQTPVSVHDFVVIERPEKITDDPEPFIAVLGNRLQEIGAEMGVGRLAEPRRLFDAKEYRAAVISAMALLEAKLRERLNKSPWPDVRRPMSLHSLVELGADQRFIPAEVRGRIESWMKLRNEIVHSSQSVSKAQAREIVDGVLQLVNQWNG